MYHGKRVKKASARCIRRRKYLAALFSCVLILSAAAGGTIAYLKTSTLAATNTFAPAQISCSVSQSGNSYTVKNTSDTAVYIRVALVSNWSDVTDPNTVHWSQPAAHVSHSGWVKGSDGFYYYPSPVAAGVSVGDPLTVTTSSSPPSSDYAFTTEVLAEVIQRVPDNAVEDAWPVTVSGGVLSVQ